MFSKNPDAPPLRPSFALFPRLRKQTLPGSRRLRRRSPETPTRGGRRQWRSAATRPAGAPP
eukprot:19720-Chlamydomonas_euryale.AAC.4